MLLCCVILYIQGRILSTTQQVRIYNISIIYNQNIDIQGMFTVLLLDTVNNGEFKIRMFLRLILMLKDNNV